MTKPDGDATAPSLRLLLVLEEIARFGKPVTPTEVNQALNLPKPTIHRLFATLEEAGFLVRDADGRSRLPGARLLDLSMSVLSSQSISAARHEILAALAREIGETCNITVPDRNEMLYIDRVETEWPLRIQMPVGTRVPLHCTASGKLYLSSLPNAQLEAFLRNAKLERRTERTLTDIDAVRREMQRTREQGYSMDNEEFLDGMICFAVPIGDARGRLVATLSFHAPLQRLSREKGQSWLPRLRSAAAEVAGLTLPSREAAPWLSDGALRPGNEAQSAGPGRRTVSAAAHQGRQPVR